MYNDWRGLFQKKESEFQKVIRNDRSIASLSPAKFDQNLESTKFQIQDSSQRRLSNVIDLYC